MPQGESSSTPSPSHSPWTKKTFVNNFKAEVDLAADRAGFVLRGDIIASIPKEIRRHIEHPEPSAQIRGFRDLFIHLNDERCPQRLRRLIEAYFRNTPYLRGHLSQSSTRLLRYVRYEALKILLYTSLYRSLFGRRYG
jgi:hypothetical protein